MRTIALLITLLIGFQSFGQFKKGSLRGDQTQMTVKPDQYHLNVGTQFFTAGKGFYGNTTYVGPSASFDVSKKLTVTMGIGSAFTQMTVPGILNSGEVKNGQKLSITSLYGYASGQYHYNSRLNLNATLLLQQDQMDYSNNQNSQYQYKDVLLGFDYKVAPGFTFSAQMGFSNRPGYSPLMHNMYGNRWQNDYFLFSEPGF